MFFVRNYKYIYNFYISQAKSPHYNLYSIDALLLCDAYHCVCYHHLSPIRALS